MKAGGCGNATSPYATTPLQTQMRAAGGKPTAAFGNRGQQQHDAPAGTHTKPPAQPPRPRVRACNDHTCCASTEQGS